MEYIVILAFASIIAASLAVNVTWEACGGNTGGYCYYLGRCHNGNECRCMNGWTGENCATAIDCGDISEQLPNVILPPSYYSNYGSLVTYACKHGTQFPDVENEDAIHQRVLRCNEDSKWGPNAKGCVALCPPLPTWMGYTVESYGQSRLQGSTLTYGCMGYYQKYNDYEKWLDGETYYEFADNSNGTKTATCGEDGEWTPAIVDCVAIEESSDGRITTSSYIVITLAVICLLGY